MWMDRGKEGAKKGDFSTFWQTLIPPFGFLSWPKSPACTYVHRNGQKRRRRRRRNLFKNFVRSSSHHYFDVLHLSLSLCTLDTLGTKGIGKKRRMEGGPLARGSFWMDEKGEEMEEEKRCKLVVSATHTSESISIWNRLSENVKNSKILFRHRDDTPTARNKFLYSLPIILPLALYLPTFLWLSTS